MQSNDSNGSNANVNDDDDSVMCVSNESSKCQDADVSDDVMYVPADPRTWNEKDVQNWIRFLSKNFEFKVPLDGSRFPKTGAELATFSKADFYIIAGSFEGGKIVADHFKYYMENVTTDVHETLKSAEEPSKD